MPFLLFQLLSILKLPPAPGINPTPSSTNPIYDSDAATIESHAPTTSYPPPKTKPKGATTTGNGEKRNFYRYSITKKSSRGLRPTMSQVEDYFLAKKRKSEVILEMDEQSPKDFIVIARTEDLIGAHDMIY